jgi:very-short-patch-repair endonuclease
LTEIFNRKETLDKRRQLRCGAPDAERLLWQKIKGKQLNGCKFRRQFGVGFYVLDFYCPALKLAIEIDGPSHDDQDAQEYDAVRQPMIEALDIRFLRFTNADIYDRLEGVLLSISNAVEELAASTPRQEEEDAPPN